MQLPGEVVSNATEPVAGGGAWQVAFGDDPVDMEATGEEERTASVAGLAVAGTCAALLLLYGLVRLIRRIARRRSGPVDDDGSP